MSQRDAYHSTPVVAERLELSSQMVRRYQLAYEAVTARRLPRDPSTRSRLIDDDELAIFEKARDLVKHDDSLSVKEALRQCLDAREDTVSEQEASRGGPSLEERFAPLRERLSGFAQELSAVRGGLEAVQAKIAEVVGGAKRRDERLEHLERTVAEQSGELGALRDELSKLRAEPSSSSASSSATPPPPSDSPARQPQNSPAPKHTPPPDTTASAHVSGERTHTPSRDQNHDQNGVRNGAQNSAHRDDPHEDPHDRRDDDRDPLWLVSWLWKI